LVLTSRLHRCVLNYLRREFAELYEEKLEEVEGEDDFSVKKESVFGEAEVDLAQW
jgi:homoserine O-acetyltransferase